MSSADDPATRLLAAKNEARRARRLAKGLGRKEDQDRLLALCRRARMARQGPGATDARRSIDTIVQGRHSPTEPGAKAISAFGTAQEDKCILGEL